MGIFTNHRKKFNKLAIEYGDKYMTKAILGGESVLKNRRKPKEIRVCLEDMTRLVLALGKELSYLSSREKSTKQDIGFMTNVAIINYNTLLEAAGFVNNLAQGLSADGDIDITAGMDTTIDGLGVGSMVKHQLTPARELAANFRFALEHGYFKGHSELNLFN